MKRDRCLCQPRLLRKSTRKRHTVPGPEREYPPGQVAATPFISTSINYWIKSAAPIISLAEMPLQASWDRYATLLPKAVLEQVPPHLTPLRLL